MGTGESVYNLTLAGLALVLSLVLLCGSQRRARALALVPRRAGCAPPLALLLAGAGLALRDPAAIGACRPGDAFIFRSPLAKDRYVICAGSK